MTNLQSETRKSLPQGVVGNGSLNDERFFTDGMDKTDLPGMKTDAAVGIAPWRTILEIALDDTADMGKLASNLVMTTGMEINFEEAVAPLGGGQEAIVQNGLLGIGSALPYHVGLVLLLVAEQPIFEMALRLRRNAFGDGPIGLLYFARANHIT